MGQSWAQIKYNSPERAARLLKERRKNEREMKGTYEEQSADELARINLRMATQIQQQKLANAGQLASTKEQGASRERAAVTAAGPSYARTKEFGRQFDEGAALREEELFQSSLTSKNKALASVYLPEMLEQQAAAGRDKPAPVWQPGDTVTAQSNIPGIVRKRKKDDLLGLNNSVALPGR